MASAQTYSGSCHCGAVKFEADLDLSQTGRCNCSICSKKRTWAAHATPETFRLLSGKKNLAEYQFGKKNTHHYFCKTCGISPYCGGVVPNHGPFTAVSVTCLDDVTPEELGALTVSFMDGRNDDWSHPPKVVNYL